MLQASVADIEREVAAQREEVEGIRARLEKDIQKLKDGQGKLREDLDASVDNVKKLEEDLQNFALKSSVDSLVGEVSSMKEEWRVEMDQSLDRITELEKRPIPRDVKLEDWATRTEVSDMIHKLKDWTENQLTESAARFDHELGQLSRTIWPFVTASIADLDRRKADWKPDVEADLTPIKKAIEEMDARIEQAMNTLRVEKADVRHHHEEFNFIRNFKPQMENMKKDIENFQEVVGGFARAISNAHTRTARWKIFGFRHKLFQILQQRDRVLTSPPFSLCGQPDIVMEMLAIPEEEPSLSAPVPPIPVPGSCSLRIWALPGLHLAFKLTLGEGSANISRRFEHKFAAGEVIDSKGRVSFQMKNLCQLDDIWVKKTNTVSITIEVIELRYETIDVFPNTVTVAEDGKDVMKYSEDVGDTHASLTDMDEEAKDSALAAMVGEHDQEFTDELSTGRCLCSDQFLQEMVKRELQAIRNRAVRRVEWRLEGASRLLEMIRAGECVDSSIFSAAGLDRMQLHFYPRGCDISEKVSAYAQACSLFLSGPSRATLRGTLVVGSHAREFEHRYKLKGDRGGRERFCKLIPDAEDSVTLAVEISEVESDLTDKSSTLLWRNYSGSNKELNPFHATFAAAVGGGVASVVGDGVKGTLSMKREDPNKVEEVVRCMSLPALNTRTHFLPQIAGQRKGR
jgi:peptidoglycan hydrolase CwlO-like protein